MKLKIEKLSFLSLITILPITGVFQSTYAASASKCNLALNKSDKFKLSFEKNYYVLEMQTASLTNVKKAIPRPANSYVISHAISTDNKILVTTEIDLSNGVQNMTSAYDIHSGRKLWSRKSSRPINSIEIQKEGTLLVKYNRDSRLEEAMTEIVDTTLGITISPKAQITEIDVQQAQNGKIVFTTFDKINNRFFETEYFTPNHQAVLNIVISKSDDRIIIIRQDSLDILEIAPKTPKKILEFKSSANLTGVAALSNNGEYLVVETSDVSRQTKKIDIFNLRDSSRRSAVISNDFGSLSAKSDSSTEFVFKIAKFRAEDSLVSLDPRTGKLQIIATKDNSKFVSNFDIDKKQSEKNEENKFKGKYYF